MSAGDALDGSSVEEKISLAFRSASLGKEKQVAALLQGSPDLVDAWVENKGAIIHQVVMPIHVLFALI